VAFARKIPVLDLKNKAHTLLVSRFLTAHQHN